MRSSARPCESPLPPAQEQYQALGVPPAPIPLHLAPCITAPPSSGAVPGCGRPPTSPHISLNSTPHSQSTLKSSTRPWSYSQSWTLGPQTHRRKQCQAPPLALYPALGVTCNPPPFCPPLHREKLNELRREKQKLVEKIMDQYRVLEPAPGRGK